MIVTFFAFLVVLAGVLATRHRSISAQLIFSLFGAAAAVQLTALGGAVVTPAAMFIPFLLVHALLDRKGPPLLQPLRWPEPGFWFLLLVLWGVLSAILFPRLFAGETSVLTVDRTSSVAGVSLVDLRPVSGNITQTVYALGSLVLLVGMGRLLATPGRLRVFRNAVLLLGALNVLAALINIGEGYLGFPSLLEYVRTEGGYALLPGGSVGGLLRITGTFPEASGFGAFTFPLFAFSFALWRSGEASARSGLLAALLLLLLLLSTSSTALAGVAVYTAVVGFGGAWRLFTSWAPRRFGAGSVVIGVVLTVLCVLILAQPQAFMSAFEYLDTTLFSKLESRSGVERGTWNLNAWYNFVDTWGVGVGLGSARASSFPLVLLSNLGVIGVLLFGAFLVALRQALGAAAPGPDAKIARAAGHAVFASLIAASISGTVFDLGVAFYAYAAAIAAAPRLQRATEPATPGDQHVLA